jgi:hypothetical protein
MALTSPGVQVSVVDESFYTPAEPGTVPVIFVASAQNKLNASGSGTAVGTLKANAGKPYLLTSQRDLAETFGDPTFQVDTNNSPIHGSELNEYGLQAAYSYLGVSNRAWVVRADVDLGQLTPRSDTPTANPEDGTYWLDTTASLYGIQEWNNNAESTTGGQTFTNKVPLVITDVNQTSGSAPYAPKNSVGTIGDYAVVSVSTINRIWYRATTGWVEVGSDGWQESWPTITSSKTTGTLTSATMTINGTTVNVSGSIATLATTINGLSISGVSAEEVNGELELYSDGTSSGSGDSTQAGEIVIAAGTGGDIVALTELGITAGTYLPPLLQISKHTNVPDSFKTTSGYNGRATGSVWLKTTTPNLGARWRVKLWNSNTALWDSVEAPIYPTAEAALLELDRTGGGDSLNIGDLYVNSNVAGDTVPLATFKVLRRGAVGATTVTSGIIDTTSFPLGNYKFDIESTSPGSDTFSGATAPGITSIDFPGSLDATALAAAIAEAITSAKIPYVNAEVDSSNRIVIKHSAGGEIRFTERTDSPGGDVISRLGISEYNYTAKTGTRFVSAEPGVDNSVAVQKQYRASNWEELSYTASATEVTQASTEGTLWYNSIVDEVDVMINNGSVWVGYKDSTSPVYSLTDPTDVNGPIVSASQPTVQSDGAALVDGDLWLDTSDLENYPVIYRYKKATDTWALVDNGDQTTENGILFADARYGSSGATGNTKATIKSLLTSNYLDPDAPDPALYPKGTLLFNTRRSGFNVKQFNKNYIDVNDINARFNDELMSGYAKDRWVTVSGNNEDGSGSFGRKAQRKVVVQALQAVVNSNDEIRNEDARRFNLIAAPGYSELIGELITLNADRGLTAFVVGDSPARLLPDATSLNEWATNVRVAVEDNDTGLVTNDEYLGVFYPWGFTSDNAGNNVVVPPSHMMLRTIALSDQVSYPWFAPAGTRRGGITNASSTGYINSEGEFVSVALNEGQRDTLYAQSVNPITFITGAGLVNYGQKTRARGASSLDRINVARLVVYLRSQLNSLAKPYIFEPNDKITRDEIKQQVESLLLELVGQRALYDFLVVCDETNNTPSRIDRNELYVDIAIEPVKSIEFIYIPLRLKNTGEIASAG